MALYRIYAPVADEWGSTTVQRIGRTYASIKKAVEAGCRASLKYGVAELKDDARSIYDRTLAGFRNGRRIDV